MNFNHIYYWSDYLIIGYNNNWITTNFLDGGTDEVEYEQVDIAILDSNVSNIPLVLSKGNIVDIDADDTSFHGY